MNDAKNLDIWLGFMVAIFIILALLETILAVPDMG